MLRISYPVALGSVVVLALLPTAIALAFFDGPAWLLAAPFDSKILLFAVLAIGVSLITVALKASRAGVDNLPGHVLQRVKDSPSLVLAPVMLICLTAWPSSAFSYVKDAIPRYVPFYSDSFWVSADRWLFLGTDPWRVSHALLGPYGTIFFDKIYIMWFGLIPLLAVWIVASTDRNLQLRGILTLYFIWIFLGNYVAMALSSCGPVFYQEIYGSDHYVPLLAELHRADAISPLAMLPIADWLLEMRKSGGFGTGISAMPSVHVAIAFFAVLFAHDYFGKRWIVIAAATFAFLIWVGSFHLAWHYAWDGIVSTVCVWAFWRLLGFVEIRDAASPLATQQQA